MSVKTRSKHRSRGAKELTKEGKGSADANQASQMKANASGRWEMSASDALKVDFVDFEK